MHCAFLALLVTCGNIVRCVFSVSEYPFHIGPLPRNQFVIYKRAAMQYIACCRHLCTLLAFCSSSKSGGDNTATSPRPLYQHQIPEIRLPIRMPAFDFKKYWIYVYTNQSFDRFGKQITLCESLSSFSQFLPEPDTGLLNPTALRKPLNSACPTQHKPLKTPIRCLRTPHLHDTFDKGGVWEDNRGVKISISCKKFFS